MCARRGARHPKHNRLVQLLQCGWIKQTPQRRTVAQAASSAVAAAGAIATHSHYRRGVGMRCVPSGVCSMACSASFAFKPLTRTTASPARPGGVESANMVSRRDSSTAACRLSCLCGIAHSAARAVGTSNRLHCLCRRIRMVGTPTSRRTARILRLLPLWAGYTMAPLPVPRITPPLHAHWWLAFNEPINGLYVAARCALRNLHPTFAFCAPRPAPQVPPDHNGGARTFCGCGGARCCACSGDAGAWRGKNGAARPRSCRLLRPDTPARASCAPYLQSPVTLTDDQLYAKMKTLEKQLEFVNIQARGWRV